VSTKKRTPTQMPASRPETPVRGRRLEGDDLQTWTRLCMSLEQVMGQMQMFQNQVGQKYGRRPDQIFDDEGYLVMNPGIRQMPEPPQAMPKDYTEKEPARA
jgi:hypothetical protein